MYDIGQPPMRTDMQLARQIRDVYHEVGKHRYTIPIINQYLRAGTMLVARKRGSEEIVGAISVSLVSSFTTLEYKAHIPDLKTDPPLLELEDLAVLEAHRYQGVGYRLLSEALSFYRHPDNEHFSRFIATSRVSPNGGPSSLNILKSNGFEEVAVVPDLYADCDLFKCPDCEGERCFCAGHYLICGGRR